MTRRTDGSSHSPIAAPAAPAAPTVRTHARTMAADASSPACPSTGAPGRRPSTGPTPRRKTTPFPLQLVVSNDQSITPCGEALPKPRHFFAERSRHDRSRPLELGEVRRGRAARTGCRTSRSGPGTCADRCAWAVQHPLSQGIGGCRTEYWRPRRDRTARGCQPRLKVPNEYVSWVQR